MLYKSCGSQCCRNIGDDVLCGRSSGSRMSFGLNGRMYRVLIFSTEILRRKLKKPKRSRLVSWLLSTTTSHQVRSRRTAKPAEAILANAYSPNKPRNEKPSGASPSKLPCSSNLIPSRNGMCIQRNMNAIPAPPNNSGAQPISFALPSLRNGSANRLLPFNKVSTWIS